jgi:hypothetical protein
MAAHFADRQTKGKANAVAAMILSHPDHLWAAWELYLQSPQPLAHRLCWGIRTAIDQAPGLVTPAFMHAVAQVLDQLTTDAEKRNWMFLFAEFPVPEDCQGQVYAVAFAWLHDPQQAIASRCYAISALDNIGQHHPDLLPELALSLRAQLPYCSSGMRYRAKLVLEKIEGRKKPASKPKHSKKANPAVDA